MKTSLPGIRLFGFSLRGLLVAVALLAVACVALKFASPLLAGIFSGVALVLCGVMAVLAFVDRGRRQAFAIGFTVIAVAYFYVSSSYDNGGRYGQLPTQQLLMLVHQQIATQWLVNYSTGERVRPYQSAGQPTAAPVYITPYAPQPAPPLSVPYMPASPATVYAAPQLAPVTTYAPVSPMILQTTPEANDFFAVGNWLWTLLFAYLGGKLAVWVYGRRVARESGSAQASSGDA